VLGSLALIQGAQADAHAHLTESALVHAQTGGQDGLSRSHALLACAARSSGRSGGVREHLVKSLQWAVESRSFISLLWALPVIGLHLLDEGQAERAMELYALASRRPFVAKSRWFADVVGNEITSAAAAALPAEQVALLEERGQGRDLQATAVELLSELRR
jgi:hypothetical protein